MTLRKKTLLIVGVVLACMVAVLSIGSQRLLMEGISNIEDQKIEKNLGISLNALSGLLEDLDVKLADWAAWDDTYAFMENKNSEYIKSNLVDSSFLNQDINLVAFIDSSGRIVFAGCFDLDTKTETPVPQSLKKYLSPGSPVFRKEESVKGIINLPEGPLLVAARPVLTSQGSGPSRGTAVMGRYLDDSVVAQLAETTGLSLTGHYWDDPRMPPDFQEARGLLTNRTYLLSLPADEAKATGYALVKDLNGQPAFILGMETQRELYSLGRDNMRRFVLFFAMLGLVPGFVALLFLERVVLSRLDRLGKEVRGIGASGDLSARIPVTGKDELSGLTSTINEMLDGQEQYQRKIQESEELFKTLSESSQTGIYIVQEGRFKFVNPRFPTLTGYSPEELVDMESYRLVFPEDRSMARENAVEMLKGRRLVPYEFRILTKDGEIRWMMETVSSIRYQGRQATLGNSVDITEYKTVEEALRESEAKYRTVFENTGTALAIIEEDTTLSLINTEFEKLTGFSKGEVQGKKSWTEFVSDRVLSKMLQFHRLRRIDPDAAPRDYEFEFVDRNGMVLNVLITIAMIPGTKKSVASLLENTERKRAEEALKENEARLRQITDNMLDIISQTDVEGELQYISPSHRYVLGYEPQDLPGKTVFDYVHPDDRSGVVEAFRKVIETRLGTRTEYRYRHADGHYVWLEASITHMLNENDRVAGAVIGARDVSERKQMEEQLGNAKALLEGVLDAIPDAVGIQDPDHRIIRLNQAGYQLLNLTPEEAQGKRCYELIGRANRCRPCATERAWKTKRLERVEKFVPELGLYLDCRSNPILDENGEIQMVVEQFYDVTERRRMEEQLWHLSLHDNLTGLYSRTYFEEEMRRLEGSRHAPIGVIVCDVDGLKLANDTLGHSAGDRLLMAAAEAIRKSFRPEDMVARIGGDEFAVLLPNSGRTIVEEACRRVRDAVAAYNTQNPEVPLSISVGFAVSDEKGANMVDLFKEADNNMYREKLHSSQSARSATVQTLMKTLEAKDFITEGHVDRLQNLVASLAAAVGVPESKINDLRLLALFHDIGKVGVSDRILLKPGPLTPEERVEMQRHCEIGHRIAQSIPDLPPIANWILKHHEWWNGEGYPLGLEEEEIPLECRILAIADAYDAMTNDRPYRKAMNRKEALDELQRCAGTQFDEELVEVFVKMIEEESVNSEE
ncbi:MAG: PAS domain S-box protein [Bacillota bacterium]